MTLSEASLVDELNEGAPKIGTSSHLRDINDLLRKQPVSDYAFFFDVDGTLSDLALTPQDAIIPISTLEDLANLSKKAPVALVSGRALVSIDRMTAPMRFPAAGQHGLEVRLAADDLEKPHRPFVIEKVEEKIHAFHLLHPELVIEYKKLSVAIHYRLAPHLAETVRGFLTFLIIKYGEILRLQRGKMVEEIKLVGANKGTAITAFMGQPSFLGKIPLFAGDDITDEDGYEVVNRMGGVTINVGAISNKAQFHLSGPHELRSWLKQLTLHTG